MFKEMAIAYTMFKESKFCKRNVIITVELGVVDDFIYIQFSSRNNLFFIFFFFVSLCYRPQLLDR